jgi:glycerophosphoryl diester phosphodiesterase
VENTLPAFAAALAHGADVLELDVHMSVDGHIVVSHDPNGLRVFGVEQAVASSRLAQIKHWSVKGSNGLRYEPATLSEVLDAFPQVALNVDVKQAKPDMIVPLFETIMHHAAEERVLLTSFSARILERVRSSGYMGPLGMSRVDAALFLLVPSAVHALPRLGSQRLQIPLRQSGLALNTRGFIERAHAAGLRIDYWVVNDPAEAERLLDLGADGIVSDDPGRIAEVFARHIRTRGWRARRAGKADPASLGRKRLNTLTAG